MSDKEIKSKKITGFLWKIVPAALIVIVFLAFYSKMNTLEKRLQRTEDVQAIERLQYAYNYYVEHMLKQEIIDCFSDSPDVLLDWLEGKWKGKEGVKKYFDVNQVPPVGFLHQLIPSAGLITVQRKMVCIRRRYDALTASARCQSNRQSLVYQWYLRNRLY